MTTAVVLITGAQGQLGRACAAALRTRGPVVAYGRAELDIADAAAVRAAVARVRPGVILNCAGYNEVDAAERHAVTAFEVNTLAVRTLARAASEAGATLVQFSTDFVFDGETDRPYDEEAAPNPKSTYAASKLVGEWLAADAGRWLVLRVESLFGADHWPGSRRVGSVDRIIDALERREPARVFIDRVVSPSYLVDVVEATAALLDRDAPSGVYHVVNSGYCTWLELAREVARHIGGGEHLVPIAVAELTLPASRPQFAALANGKLAAAAYAMPSWQDALARYLTFRAARSAPPGRQSPDRP